ncbi:hypothetical protein Cgig2_009855 [Carnegiea gigantea]|uniref:Uncharacterized protein n=1 Tax=Carnegiea gigantea TaxID=171969 RepID=A0A9Q1KNE1_9CARY|nr:hypothetical protein Cgig2_009855 [Carnegiea gigantea]
MSEKDLFRDVRSSAMENGVKLSEFPGFRWHPPGRENQRWPLSTCGDWVRLASHWRKMKKNVVIPLYKIELPEAKNLQKMVKSLDRLNEAKHKAQDQGLTQAQSQAQNDNKPLLSEAAAWVDNLIVSPSTKKVIPSGSSLESQPKVSSLTTNRPNKLPIRRPRPRIASNL